MQLQRFVTTTFVVTNTTRSTLILLQRLCLQQNYQNARHDINKQKKKEILLMLHFSLFYHLIASHSQMCILS